MSPPTPTVTAAGTKNTGDSLKEPKAISNEMSPA